MKTFAERLIARRKELGLTQEELAKRMGYKYKSSINKIEMGVNDIPLSKVEEFAVALDTTPSYLMGWEDEEQKEDASITERDRSINAIMNIFSKLSPEEKLDIICYASEIIDKRKDNQ